MGSLRKSRTNRQVQNQENSGSMFGWFKNRHRKKILAQPWPDEWSSHITRNVRLTAGLDTTEMNLLQRCVKVIAAEKHWEGCEGLEITDEMRVTIAAQASLMLLGVKDFYFDIVRTILIFPRAFRRQTSRGSVFDETQHRAGEAWQGGPIILSWHDALQGGRNEDDGNNVVIHEFAHALDGLDGEMGGSLVFGDRATTEQWARVLKREHSDLSEAKRLGRRSLMDQYGAKNPAEFFAVASETFFERPRRLRIEHPELFTLLTKYYRIDPSSWQDR